MPTSPEGAFPGATNDVDASPDRADITAFVGVEERRMVYLALRSSMLLGIPFTDSVEQICVAVGADRSDNRRAARLVRVVKSLGATITDADNADLPLWGAFEKSGLLTSLQEKAVLSMSVSAFTAAVSADRAELLGCLLQVV